LRVGEPVGGDGVVSPDEVDAADDVEPGPEGAGTPSVSEMLLAMYCFTLRGDC
jgi:hypothetical protein